MRIDSTHWTFFLDACIRNQNNEKYRDLLKNDTLVKKLRDGCNEEMHEGKPHGGTNWGTGDPEGWWNDALAYWKKGDKSAAFWCLGVLGHMVCDMGVPAHACHIGHGWGEGFWHMDNLEQMAFSNWRPDYDKIAGVYTDDYGTSDEYGAPGIPRLSEPWKYYLFSQQMTLFKLEREESPKGRGWLGDSRYWIPPTDPYDNATQHNYGRYAGWLAVGDLAYGDRFSKTWVGSTTWPWKTNWEKTLLSHIQQRLCAVADYTLQSALDVFLSTPVEAEGNVTSALVPGEALTGQLEIHGGVRAGRHAPLFLQGTEGGAQACCQPRLPAETKFSRRSSALDDQNVVRWVWKAPQSGYYGFDTVGSSFNTYLEASERRSEGWTPLATSNDIGPDNPFSYVCILASAGRTYEIAVTGSEPAEAGSVQLNFYPEQIVWNSEDLGIQDSVFVSAAAPDGSLARLQGTVTQARRAGLSKDKRPVLFEDVPDCSHLALWVENEGGEVILDGQRPSGASANDRLQLLDFDGTHLLLGLSDPSAMINRKRTIGDETIEVLLCEVEAGRLHQVGGRMVDHFCSAEIVGDKVMVTTWQSGLSETGALEPRMGVTWFSFDLRKPLWGVNPSLFSLGRTMPGSHVFRSFENGIALVVETLTPQGVGSTHCLEKGDGDSIEFMAGDDGTLAWRTRDEEGGCLLSVEDPEGNVLLGEEPLPGVEGEWNLVSVWGENIYVRLGGGGEEIVHFRLLADGCPEEVSRIVEKYFSGLAFDRQGNLYVETFDAERNQSGLAAYDGTGFLLFKDQPSAGEIELLEDGVYTRTCAVAEGAGRRVVVTFYREGAAFSWHSFLAP